MTNESWEELTKDWGDCAVILHNRPFYSVEVIEDKAKPAPPKVVRVTRSFYDLNKPNRDLELFDLL